MHALLFCCKLLFHHGNCRGKFLHRDIECRSYAEVVLFREQQHAVLFACFRHIGGGPRFRQHADEKPEACHRFDALCALKLCFDVFSLFHDSLQKRAVDAAEHRACGCRAYGVPAEG